MGSHCASDLRGIIRWLPVKPTPAVERVYRRIEVHPLGCWNWTGAVNHGGYGIIQLGRGSGTDRTHRVVYEAEVGPIPDEYTIDHLCQNPACCNPTHLEPVTRAENARRQNAAGRGNGNRDRTHCQRGHPFDEANTYIRPDGNRTCRACRNAAHYRWRTTQK